MELSASFGQRLLWLLQRSVGRSGALNCPVILRLRGRLDEGLLRAALASLVARHEALRTTFTGAGHQLTQVVHDPVPPEWEIDDVRGAAEVDRRLADELAQQVDFADWPTRTRLWRVADDEHVLCLTMHHLVTDAWSCGLLYRELTETLARLGAGAAAPDPPRWQYADFTRWQYDFFDSTAAGRYRAFWTRQLTGLQLPAVPMTPRARQRQRITDIARRDIPAGVTDGLARLAKAERTTLFAVLLAAYYAALHRRTGQDDLAMTSLFANRGQREVAGTVGFVANMVVLRCAVPPRATFTELVRRAATTAREAFLHERLPYQLLPIPTANTGTQRADDVVFQMLGEPITVSARAAGLEISGIVPQGVARFDLELAVIPHGRGLQVQVFYACDRLDPVWAEALADDYLAVVGAVADRPDLPLPALPALATRE